MSTTSHNPTLAVRLPEAALLLSVSKRHLWGLVKSGAIPHFRLGRRILFSPSALESWIAERLSTTC